MDSSLTALPQSTNGDGLQPSPEPSRRRTGILVIHGIGTQNPYSTLDSFARGLYKHFGGPACPGYAMSTRWTERGADPSHQQQSWTQAQIRFVKSAGVAPKSAPDELTLSEYYWSPVTKGKLKDLEVLTWLIRTGLSPFRYLNENLQAMEPEEPGGSSQSAAQRSKRAAAYARAGHTGRFSFMNFVLAREFFRFLVLYAPLLLSFLALGVFLEDLPALPALLASSIGNAKSLFIALIAATRLLILFSLMGYFLTWRRWVHLRISNTESRRFSREALIGAILLAAALFIVPAWYSGALRPPAHDAGWLRWLWLYAGHLTLLDPRFQPLFRPLVELGVAAVIRSIFIFFLGDIAIYTNLNQRSANFAVRAQILEECGHALTGLYRDMQQDGDDFELVIAAHSLGTVIAYDTVNDLFNRARIDQPAPGPETPPVDAVDVCAHLRGMLTFGSPLNKTYYFFRDQSPAEALIRAQIVDQLHSFRLVPPCRVLPDAPLTPMPFPPDSSLPRQIEEFGWYNVWSTMDVISGKLYFYDLPQSCQLHLWYKIPLLAHLAYWGDDRMYAWFAEHLLSPPATLRNPALPVGQVLAGTP